MSATHHPAASSIATPPTSSCPILRPSFGGPQILGENFGRIGYASAAALFDAFKQSERWHVCGFFDFCRSNALLAHIRDEDWVPFAAAAAHYAIKLIAATE